MSPHKNYIIFQKAPSPRISPHVKFQNWQSKNPGINSRTYGTYSRTALEKNSGMFEATKCQQVLHNSKVWSIEVKLRKDFWDKDVKHILILYINSLSTIYIFNFCFSWGYIIIHKCQPNTFRNQAVSIAEWSENFFSKSYPQILCEINRFCLYNYKCIFQKCYIDNYSLYRLS